MAKKENQTIMSETIVLRNLKLSDNKGITDYIIYTILTLVCFATFYPFWYTFVISISSIEGYHADMYHIIPNSFDLSSYLYAIKHPDFLNSLFITVSVTVLGTLLSMFFSTMGAYVLSKKQLIGGGLLFRLIIFTMFFNGGVIPYYILVSKLGMMNTIFAYFVPVSINTFHLIILKNGFLSNPVSLEESAKIDGCNEITILYRIIIPISKPIIATISLFYAVFYWNDFFQPLLFSSGQKTYPLSMFLRSLLGNISSYSFQAMGNEMLVPEMIKAAFIIISIIPILAVYPFIQTYFVKGVMIGSIKE